MNTLEKIKRFLVAGMITSQIKERFSRRCKRRWYCRQY